MKSCLSCPVQSAATDSQAMDRANLPQVQAQLVEPRSTIFLKSDCVEDVNLQGKRTDKKLHYLR